MANLYKDFGHKFLDVYLTFSKILILFWPIICCWTKFNCCKWPNIEQKNLTIWSPACRPRDKTLTAIYLKNGQTPASFCLFLVFSNKQYNICKKSMQKNVHPVKGTGIRTHNLLNMSSHP